MSTEKKAPKPKEPTKSRQTRPKPPVRRPPKIPPQYDTPEKIPYWCEMRPKMTD